MEAFKALSLSEKNEKADKVYKMWIKMKNIIIDEEMIEEAEELDNNQDRQCVRPCGKLKVDGANYNCSICPVLYTRSKITNRFDSTQSIIFNETLQCDSYKEGVYCIICTKSDCPYKGPVYFGTTDNFHKRCGSHKNNIVTGNTNAPDFQSVHEHFIGHNDEDNLQHFRFVPVENVVNTLTSPKAREARERQFMRQFGTYGVYGFNETCPRITEDTNRVEIEQSTSSRVLFTPAPGGSVQRLMKDVEDRIWFYLIIQNSHQYTQDGKKCMTGMSKIQDFLAHYFQVDDVTSRSFLKHMQESFNENLPRYVATKKEQQDLREWFIWENKPDTKYVFILNPLSATSMEDEISVEKSSLFDLLVDPETLELNNKTLRDLFLKDPVISAQKDRTECNLLKKRKLLDMLLDGNLPIAPKRSKF